MTHQEHIKSLTETILRFATVMSKTKNEDRINDLAWATIRACNTLEKITTKEIITTTSGEGATPLPIPNNNYNGNNY